MEGILGQPQERDRGVAKVCAPVEHRGVTGQHGLRCDVKSSR